MVTNGNKWQLLATLVTNGDFFLILHLLETLGNLWQIFAIFSVSLLQSVTVSGSVLQSVTVSGSWVVVRAVCGSLLQSLAIMTICGNQWQSVAVNWQSLLICISLSAAGAKANCALDPMLAFSRTFSISRNSQTP